MTDPQGAIAVVVTNRGLLLKPPASDKFRLLCVEAMRSTVTDTPPVALASGGRLLVATFEGLLASDDGGCTWEPVSAFGETNVPTMATVAGDRDSLVVATFGGAVAGLHISHDGGRTFEKLLALGDTEYVGSVAVAPSDPNRIYATGQDFATGESVLFFLRSSDGGATWERLPLAQESTDYRFVVRAVNRQDPDTLLISSEAFEPTGTPARLMESDDGGETFTEVFRSFEITSAGYHEGGGRWASSSSGLFESDASGSPFTAVWEASSVSCADERGGELYACVTFEQDDHLVPGVGHWVAGATPSVEPVVLFPAADEPVACDPGSESYQVCQTPWRDWQREVLDSNSSAATPGMGVEVDAGMMPTNAVVDGPTAAAPSQTDGMQSNPSPTAGPAPTRASPAPQASDAPTPRAGCGCRILASEVADSDMPRSGAALWFAAAVVALTNARARRRRA